MFGDPNQLPPIVKSTAYKSYSNFDTSLFERLIKNGHPSITLNHQGRTRSEIVDLYRWRYEKLLDMDYILSLILLKPSIRLEFICICV